MTTENNTLSTVKRTLEILSMFKHKNEYTLQEITDTLDASKSIIYRALYTLESMGYLIKDEKTKIYSLGYEVYRLGKSFERNNKIKQVAYPFLNELYKKVNETVCIVVPDYHALSALQVMEIETTHPVKHTINVSRVGDLHTGATRKTLLAHLDDETIKQVIENKGLPQKTPDTITNEKRLFEELSKIKEQGFGESYAELIVDLYSVAAPIFGYNNELIGSLGIYLPIYRLEDRQKDFINLVKTYSEKISEALS